MSTTYPFRCARLIRSQYFQLHTNNSFILHIRTIQSSSPLLDPYSHQPLRSTFHSLHSTMGKILTYRMFGCYPWVRNWLQNVTPPGGIHRSNIRTFDYAKILQHLPNHLDLLWRFIAWFFLMFSKLTIQNKIFYCHCRWPDPSSALSAPSWLPAYALCSPALKVFQRPQPILLFWSLAALDRQNSDCRI